VVRVEGGGVGETPPRFYVQGSISPK
jgi:hypothetical protein